MVRWLVSELSVVAGSLAGSLAGCEGGAVLHWGGKTRTGVAPGQA